MQLDFREESGRAVLDTDNFKLIFESIVLTPPAGQVSGGATGSMQISGSGTSRIELTMLDHKLTNSYSNGVNTISIDQFRITVSDQGRKLQIGDSTFDVGAKKKVIVIREDESAQVNEG